MNESSKDELIDSNFYFIKGFGLARKSVEIKSIDYWQLNNNEESFFNLTGYIRCLNDSCLIIPLNYSEKKIKEFKLFDFSNQKRSWRLFYKYKDGRWEGDTVAFRKIRVEKSDTIYTYNLQPFYYNLFNHKNYYYGQEFVVDVSKKYGIKSIAYHDYGGEFEYKLDFFPKQTFINHKDKRRIDL